MLRVPLVVAGRVGDWLWLLVALVVVAVAHRRLGPSSHGPTTRVRSDLMPGHHPRRRP
jgi:hypothetical protein